CPKSADLEDCGVDRANGAKTPPPRNPALPHSARREALFRDARVFPHQPMPAPSRLRRSRDRFCAPPLLPSTWAAASARPLEPRPASAAFALYLLLPILVVMAIFIFGEPTLSPPLQKIVDAQLDQIKLESESEADFMRCEPLIRRALTFSILNR